METYSRNPFISYDKIDDKGIRAEVKVSTGLGLIKELKPSSTGKSNNVIIECSNTPWALSGNLPVNSPLTKIVEEAQASQEPLFFRIETVRQKNIPRETSMAELTPKNDATSARKNIFKQLVAVKRVDDEEWTLSTAIATRFEEDPVDNRNELPTDVSLEEFTGGQSNNAPAKKWSKRFENPPYETLNPNGKLNPGSIAVSVPLNLYTYVVDYERENEELNELNNSQRVYIAKVMLAVSNDLQLAIYNGELEKPDLSAGSHTRARALIFEGIRSYAPITNDLLDGENVNSDKLKEWKNLLFEKALAMWKWSLKETSNFI